MKEKEDNLFFRIHLPRNGRQNVEYLKHPLSSGISIAPLALPSFSTSELTISVSSSSVKNGNIISL